MAYFLQQCLNGLQVSAFYAVLAAGYVLVHAVTRRTNLAFGAIAMWGGHLAVLTVTALAASFYMAESRALGLAVALAIAGNAALGLLLARSVAVPLAERPPLAMPVATLGVAIVLEETARLSAGNRELWLQPVLAERIVLLGDTRFPVVATFMQVVNIAVAALVLAATLAAIARHPAGRLWRAVSDDPVMARLLGVNTARVVAGSVVAGCALAGVAGVLSAVYYGTASFHVGLILGLKVLYVAILGGLSSPGGAIAGAAALGFFETLWSAYFPLAWRDVASFAALTLLLALRPAGLFSGVERVDHAR